MQSYVEIGSSDTLANSLSEILNNDKSVMSCHSGTAFPTVNLQVGMLCFRTDLNQVFQLKNATPTWFLLLDLSGTGALVATATNATQLNGQAASYYQQSLGFTPVQQGTGTSQTTNVLKMGWSAASKIRVMVDTTDFGTIWPIDISGNAGSATTATNSLSLGGQLAAAYALQGANANAYTSQQNYQGNQGAAMNVATTGLGAIMVQGDGTHAAFMSFNRGSYAGYFGIDTDNKWKVGGWSAGALAYALFHENNLPTWSQVSSKPTTVSGYGITDIAQNGSQIFTSSNSFTVPSGVSQIWVTGVGGGGSGGATGGNCAGGYGAAGASSFRTPLTVTPGGVYTVTVGAAGVASSFGSLLTLNPGGNGAASIGNNLTGANGTAGSPSYLFGVSTTVGVSTVGIKSGANSGVGGVPATAGSTGIIIVEW